MTPIKELPNKSIVSFGQNFLFSSGLADVCRGSQMHGCCTGETSGHSSQSHELDLSK
ncbi:hypothetical protein IscW_ISCW013019 [Ixodes scapularis]|uniref:Uncharacterized protein n=1 Tax=Ixodes scapularis TaxID=6945 RepID=B7QBZ7_IXOSC|nr:hypothetical protein IscW_ISCW013019 [Ixodes scapularis]|eukprot:XP_002413061.1 hypothetical protein IscW_ISCW013019 [Ixodes scapularis]